MMNRFDAEFRRVFNLLRGTKAFEQALAGARQDASTKRQALLAQIREVKRDYGLRLSALDKPYVAARAKLERAREEFHKAEREHDAARAAWSGCQTRMGATVSKLNLELKAHADRRVYQLRHWASEAWQLARVSWSRVRVATQRNYFGQTRQIAVGNFEEVSAAMLEVDAVVKRCEAMLVEDYGTDPLPELRRLQARVLRAARSVGCNLPALELVEEQTWAETLANLEQARMDAAGVALLPENARPGI